MIRILLLYVICTAAIGLPPALISYYPAPFGLVPHFGLMFAFFSVLTLMLVTTIAFGQNRNGTTGAQLFLGFTVIKLLACMGFALYFLRSYRVNNTQFMLCFFYLYLLNTVFEIYILLSNLRLQNKK